MRKRSLTKRNAGFTLMEAAVTIGVLFVVMGTVTVVFQAMTQGASSSQLSLLTQRESDRVLSAVLEDLHPSRQEDLDAVWAAIRANHGGVLRTPYGVLVGSEKLVREVFGDDGRRYSVRKYWSRLRQAFGDIYLSMDPRPVDFPGKDPSQPRRQRPYHRQVREGDYAERAAAFLRLDAGIDLVLAFADGRPASLASISLALPGRAI